MKKSQLKATLKPIVKECITEVLLVEDISGYFSDHYNQAKGTGDKKPTEMVGNDKKQSMKAGDILKKYNI